MDRDELFKAWIEDYGGVILKIVRAYAFHPQDEDDLFQEIALQLWMSIPSFKGRSKPSTWIYKVALNTAFVWKRKQGKHSKQTLGETEFPGPGATPARAAEDREDLAWLYEEIRELNKIDRSIVLLYLEDLSYRDMAEILGLSESNVGARLNRLKNRLADEYARRAK